MRLQSGVFLLLGLAVANGILSRVLIEKDDAKLFDYFSKAGFDMSPLHGNESILEVVGEYDQVPAIGLTVEKGRPFSEGPPDGYNTPEEIFEAFQELAASNTRIAQLIDLNTLLGTPRTIEGRTLYALKLSANAREDEDKPNVLVVSNHHAREIITPQLALDTATRLVEGYVAGNAEIRSIFERYQVYVMYTMNPDGLAYMWSTDNFWRKNRRNNGDGTYGVDLNRNYPFGWDFSCGGSTVTSSQTYRGTAPASEAETQTMLAFHAHRAFAIVLDFHSFARDTRPNYASCAGLPPAVNDLFQEKAAQFAQLMDYVKGESCCTGGQISSAYHDQGAQSVLVETGTSFQPPATEMRAELVRVWPGTLWYLSQTIPLQGHVVDAVNGRPLAAKLAVAEVEWRHGESFSAHPSSGRYHLWLKEGTYSITMSADGYSPLTKAVTIPTGGVVVDWRLQRA